MGSNAAMVEAVRTVASEYHEAAGRNIDDMTMRFFEAPAGSVTDQIRKLTKVDGEKLVVLDIPAGGKYYICDGAAADVTSEGILGRRRVGEGHTAAVGMSGGVLESGSAPARGKDGCGVCCIAIRHQFSPIS